MVWECDLCKQVFSKQTLLRRHRNTKRHIEAQYSDAGLLIPLLNFTHQCSRCGKSFARADALTRHRLKHTGYSAKCFLCSKALRHDDLKRHEPVCVNRHLDRLRKSAKVDNSNGLAINQPPLEFQWDPTATESFSTKEEAFRFVRRRTNDLNAATQDLGNLASYAIDRDDHQVCEAVCAVASSLSISFTDMAKRSASNRRKHQAPKGRFWYLKLLLHGETNIGAVFGYATIHEHTGEFIPSDSSALHLACYQGFPEITRSLILSGADINLSVYGGTSPLCVAVGELHLDIIRILLSNGADANEGLPLVICLDAFFRYGCDASIAGDIATSLIQNGADIYVGTGSEENALHLAMSCAHIRLLRSIIAKSPPRDFLDAVNYRGTTALHVAARKGFLEGVQLLLDLGTEATNLKNNNGDTPLEGAVWSGHDIVVQCLLAADNRHSEQTLYSALLEAIGNNQVKNIRLLIKAGAVLTEDSDARNLDFFISDTDLGQKTIELLLDEGTRVNLLSEACIDTLLDWWIDNEFGDSEMRDESTPNVNLLRQQYTFFGILPWQVVGTDKADTV